ncbi:hypothetical protein FVER53590_00075 [Fusarium verticillioides]|nr:hypothetical protein FVER53590_00075 [Fusarium verticillioides]
MPEEGNAEPEPQFIAAFNFRVQKTGDIIDLASSIEPVISYGPNHHETNMNQIWSVFSVSEKSTVLVKSEANQQWLVATGNGQPTSTGNPHWSEESAQWITQGGDSLFMISTFLGTTFDVSNPSPLLEHSYRVSPLVSNGGYIRRDSNDRLRTDRISVSLIALSQRSAGSGVFELNFNSQRYLPFENAGAISTWKLELSQHVCQFSYESISDVILHLKYTSRQGGAELRASAEDAVKRLVAAADGVSEGDGLFALIDLAGDFANAWALVQSQAQAGQAGDLLVSMGNIGVVLPYWSVGLVVKVQSVTLISRCSPEVAAILSVDLLYGKDDERSFGDGVGRTDGWDSREISNLDADIANWGLRLKRKYQGENLKLASTRTMYLIIHLVLEFPLAVYSNTLIRRNGGLSRSRSDYPAIMLPNATFLFHNPDGSVITKGDIEYSWSSTKDWVAFFENEFKTMQTIHIVGPAEMEQIAPDEIKAIWAVTYHAGTKEHEGGVHGTGGGHYHETWKKVGDDWFMESLRMERLYWKLLSV